MGRKTNSKKRKLTLGELMFLQRIQQVGQCYCINCGLTLANTDALSHYASTGLCIHCGLDASDSWTDVNL